ncbi:MAG: Hsp33 family molecular chaperone HslO [Acidobacteriota bacterium]|nr:Hsp33 family molecular chaperone HslO [Acidobacteriota bacterium]
MQEREDHLIQGLTADATVRVIAAVTTDLVNEACGRHSTSPTASAALGRAMTGALLLGRSYKDLEYITLRFDCKGEIGGITAEASAHGTVRGYVKNPLADAPPNAQGKLNVRGIVVGEGGKGGKGMLHVIREAGAEIGLMKDQYIGSVPIVSGEIAEDIAHYLAASEQINSAISLGVFVESEQGIVTAAGGYLIQLMPGAESGTIAAIEKAIASAPRVTDLIRGGADAEQMMRRVLGDLSLEVLNTHPASFRCTCSYERAVNIVTMLGETEVRDMLEKDNGAELICHFCSAVYYLDDSTLQNILNPPPPVLM